MQFYLNALNKFNIISVNNVHFNVTCLLADEEIGRSGSHYSVGNRSEMQEKGKFGPAHLLLAIFEEIRKPSVVSTV
jgi:hypothetical protein